jgi:hypothetical protein
MDDDLFYQQFMTTQPRLPAHPPPYSSVSPTLYDKASPPNVGEGRVEKRAEAESNRRKHSRESRPSGRDSAVVLPSRPQGEIARDPAPAPDTQVSSQTEGLPDYSTSIALEGVFCKKHEIENTTKRAEDRQWHPMFVTLQGTSLKLYTVKKDWGWGRSRDGPTISPDNPPWVRRSKLEKSYSLLHADAGIAADYKKRRYVIRVRAETDQFLLSCIELSTFVKWLESLFAAIDVAAPIDERDFPRDMSIPRIQRVRFFRGQSPTRIPYPTPNPREPASEGSGSQPAASSPAAMSPLEAALAVQPAPFRGRLRDVPMASPAHAIQDSDSEDDRGEGSDTDGDEDGAPSMPPARVERIHRLSNTSYPNIAIDPSSGKWFPEHHWSNAHDMLYAKLCYSNLLFRSPRKTNYIIKQGKRWYVDWTTGRMVRVLPPTYGEIDYFGPWQVVHSENSRL